MNWKLIGGLSFGGLVTGLLTIYWFSPRTEPFITLPILLGSAYLVAKKADRRYFLHGLIIGLLSTVWLVMIRMQFAPEYLSHHAREAEKFARMAKAGISNTEALFWVTLVTGLMSTVALGLFSAMAGKALNQARGKHRHHHHHHHHSHGGHHHGKGGHSKTELRMDDND